MVRSSGEHRVATQEVHANKLPTAERDRVPYRSVPHRPRQIYRGVVVILQGRHRSAVVATALALLLLIVGVVALVTLSDSAPTGTRAIWGAAVRAELAANPVAAFQGPPVRGYSTLPGVGAVTDVTVYPPSKRSGRFTVIFRLAQFTDSALVYVSGGPRPYDTCDKSLGGGWLKIAPMNAMGICTAGFQYAPGP